MSEPLAQLISREAMTSAADRFDAEVDYALKAQVHYWQAIVTHKVADAALDRLDAGEPPILDVETVRLVMLGCYICEQAYTPALRRRKCKGDPS